MKKALALAGGGARGSFEIGVWKALRELGWRFDVVTGVSVGALNAGIVAMDDPETATQVWENITTSQVLDVEDKSLDERIGLGSTVRLIQEAAATGANGIKCDGLRSILERCIDEERVRASGVEVGVITVGLDDRKPYRLFLPDIPDGRLCDYLLASAAFYPFMEPVEIDGKRYIDGGYYDTMPVELAISAGADEVVAVNLKAVGLYRGYDASAARVIRIEPKWDLGHHLIFNKSVAQTNIALGYQEAMRVFGKAEGWKYSFEKGSFASFAEAHRAEIEELIRDLGPATTPGQWAISGLYRELRRRGAADRSLGELLRAACDMAAEMMKLDPTRVYTAEKTQTLLTEKYDELMTQIRVETGKKMTAAQLNRIARLLGDIGVAGSVAATLEKKGLPDARAAVLTAGTMFPHETAAGLAVYLMKKLL
ncbi:MAG: patatin-like phospholipase family protein [Eubacteriales bacterium]|nr:patatin-like phospholipase family protein [Eubacteriales bacterium]